MFMKIIERTLEGIFYIPFMTLNIDLFYSICLIPCSARTIFYYMYQTVFCKRNILRCVLTILKYFKKNFFSLVFGNYMKKNY